MNASRIIVRLLHAPLLAVWLLSGWSLAWAQEKVTLRLDFIPNGYHGPFYLALDKGYYKAEGLEVQIGRGFGSVDTIKRVDSGADTFGFADFYTAVKGVAEGALINQGQDIVVFDHRDHLSIMGSGIIASEATVRTRPEVIRKFLKATYRGAQDFARDPQAAPPVLIRYNPEGNAANYSAQAKASLGFWATSVAKQRGFGWMDDAKMRNTVEQAAQGFKLERKITAAEFFTNEFVPVPPIK